MPSMSNSDLEVDTYRGLDVETEGLKKEASRPDSSPQSNNTLSMIHTSMNTK